MVGKISELTVLTDPDDNDEVEVRDVSAGAVDAANSKILRQDFLGRDSWKFPVRAATVVNGALATAYENGDTIDGVVLATGDRILIKDQTTGSENGVYKVNASGAPTRELDFNSSLKVVGGLLVPVVEGTINTFSLWILVAVGTVVVGTTALTFIQFKGGQDRVLLKPVVNQKIIANTSVIVGEYYQLDSGIELAIDSGANLTVT